MITEHEKVTLRSRDGTEIVRYFPNPSPMDLEIGATLFPANPHYGSALHREGYFKWNENCIAKRDGSD